MKPISENYKGDKKKEPKCLKWRVEASTKPQPHIWAIELSPQIWACVVMRRQQRRGEGEREKETKKKRRDGETKWTEALVRES